MAYFYTSNCSKYPQIYDNYQYYHHQYNNNNNNNYDSTNHDYSRYVQSTYDEPQFHGNAYHYQHSPNPSLVGYYYSNYYQPESKNNAYFHENGGDYYYDDVVSTQYIVSYDTTTTTTNGEAKKVVNEVFFEEYNPEPFHGGYDINLTYGKPLPPSDDICYPVSKNEVVGNNPNVPSLDDNKRIVESEAVSEQINDDDDDDEFDEDDDDYDDDGGEGEGEEEEEEKDELGKETMVIAPIASLGDALDKKEEDKKVDVGEKKDDFDKESSKKKSVSFKDEIHEKDNKNQNVGEVIQVETPSKIEAEKEQEQEQGNKEDINGSHEIRRQIPAGYGMESLDLCEGLFGGYFPCLWKRKQRNNNIQESSSYNYDEKLSDYDYDYDYCCKDTVDYLFGNPNPYGGSMPEKGSYGDPVYGYQRHYPQQPVTEQVDCYGGNSSWLQNTRYYYYDHNNGDYYQ